MKTLTLITVVSFSLIGCAQQHNIDDSFDKEYGSVRIYSTPDIKIAQSKADGYCGKHAFYLKELHDSNIAIVNKDPSMGGLFKYIPFLCDARDAAVAGNPEAQEIYKKEMDDAYEALDKAKQHQYEVHKAYAKKHGGDVYSTVNPDGSVDAHSFDVKGNECHGTSSQYGSDVYCD